MNFPWRKRAIADPLAIRIPLVIGGNLVGEAVGMTDGGVTYLTDLYVEPQWRGHGHGTDLVRDFIEAAKETTIVLLTSEAKEFYARLGFVERTAMVWRKE